MIFARPQGLGQPQMPMGMAPPQQLQPGMQPGMQLHPALLAQLAQMRGLGGLGGSSPMMPQMGLGRPNMGIQPLSPASAYSLR